MLTIRREQIHVFAAAQEREWERQLADYLAAEYPAHAQRMGDEGLLALIRRARAAGKPYRIETAGALSLWTELWLLFGDGLRRSPDRAWAENILRHDTLPDYIKVDHVRERLTSRTGGRPVVPANELGGK